MKKPCVICGDILEANGREIVCSELCRIIQYRKIKTDWNNEHKEQVNHYRSTNPTYRKIHRESNRKYRRHNKKRLYEDWKKRKEDVGFRIACNLRNRVSMAIKGNIKRGKTLELLGCDILTLKNHLQNKFSKGMTWNNYGAWHIDHIEPCVAFDLSKEEEQKKCMHYTNLQPLWAKDNLIKHSKRTGNL